MNQRNCPQCGIKLYGNDICPKCGCIIESNAHTIETSYYDYPVKKKENQSAQKAREYSSANHLALLIISWISLIFCFLGILVSFIIGCCFFYYWKRLSMVYTEPEYGYIVGVAITAIGMVSSLVCFTRLSIIRRREGHDKTNTLPWIGIIISMSLATALLIVCAVV